MRARRALTALIALLAMVTTSCVGPVLVDDHYRGKAISALGASESTVKAAELLAREVGRERVPSPMAAVILRQKEEEASWHASAFATRQPPRGGDDLRRHVLPLLEEAAARVTDLRIAAFRGELDRIAELEASLGSLAEELQQKKHELEQREGDL